MLAAALSIVAGACSGGDSGEETEGGPPGPTKTSNDAGGNGGNQKPGATAASGANDDFHACSLFSGAELGSAVGVQLNDGRDYLATAPGATNCVWEGGANIFVEVLLEGGRDWNSAIHIPGARDDDMEKIEGVGDVATWDSLLNTLDVVDGDRFVSVQPLVGVSGLKDQEVAVQVAKLTLERLP